MLKRLLFELSCSKGRHQKYAWDAHLVLSDRAKLEAVEGRLGEGLIEPVGVSSACNNPAFTTFHSLALHSYYENQQPKFLAKVMGAFPPARHPHHNIDSVAYLATLRPRGAAAHLRACRPVRQEPARVVAAMSMGNTCRSQRLAFGAVLRLAVNRP